MGTGFGRVTDFDVDSREGENQVGALRRSGHHLTQGERFRGSSC